MAWTSPNVFIAGVLVNAATLNRILRDNLNWLMTGEAWIAVSTFQNGWTAGTPTPSYRRLGGTVVMEGMVNVGATPISNIFTLPVGYMPSKQLVVSVFVSCASGPNIGDMRVDPGGAVQLANQPPVVTYGALSAVQISCAFPIEQ